MEKKNLRIDEIEEKKANSGKVYWRVKTNDGWTSCFEKEVVEQLQKNIEKYVNVTIATSDKNDFVNIRKFNGVVEEQQDPPVEVVKPVISEPATTMRKSVKGTAYEKDPVGLAIEVFNTLVISKGEEEINVEELMKLSVNLIKEAQKSF